MDINKEYITKKNTYAGKNLPKYIIIHETGNYGSGAGAKRHAQAQSAGNLNTSVHYYCGSDGIYQTAEHIDGTYSIGIEYGGNHAITDATNRNTINIEICVNPDGDYDVARAKAIELTKHLISTTGIPSEKVIRHYDAKGKCCPAKMLSQPTLWEDFKLQVGAIANAESVELSEDAEEVKTLVWYRVGTGWKDGICENQFGAYHNKDFAIADCSANQNVYDESGTIVYAGSGKSNSNTTANAATNTSSSKSTAATTSYTQKQFIKEVQSVTGSNVDGYAGSETIGNTVTVSRTKNNRHKVVTSLERRLRQLGYYTGEIEADAGKTPSFGPKMETAVNQYQKKILKYTKTDGEITAKQKMWKSLLGMI